MDWEIFRQFLRVVGGRDGSAADLRALLRTLPPGELLLADAYIKNVGYEDIVDLFKEELAEQGREDDLTVRPRAARRRVRAAKPRNAWTCPGQCHLH